jgi:hypothetical protein
MQEWISFMFYNPKESHLQFLKFVSITTIGIDGEEEVSLETQPERMTK